MSVPAANDSDVEFVVSHELAEAARREGVKLPEGRRVRLTLVTSSGGQSPRRTLPWISKAHSGKGDLGTRTKDVVREELGQRSE